MIFIGTELGLSLQQYHLISHWSFPLTTHFGSLEIGKRHFHNEELHDFYCSRSMKRVTWWRDRRNTYTKFFGTGEGKRSLWRLGRRWDNNIKMHLKGTGGEDVEYIHVAQDRDQWRDLMNTVKNTFKFHKRWGTSWLADRLPAFEEELCFMELISWSLL
jgi:hypothetical protein